MTTLTSPCLDAGPLVPRTLAAAKMVRTKAITRNLRLSIGKAAGADVAQGGQGQQAPDAPQGFSGEGAAETRLRVARVLGLEPLTRSPNEGQGTGLPGRAKSAETRAKMSAAKRALWKDGRPAEHCVAISNGLIRSHEERRVAQEFKRRQERVQPVVSQTRVHLVKEVRSLSSCLGSQCACGCALVPSRWRSPIVLERMTLGPSSHLSATCTQEAMVERMHLKEEIITWLDSFEASTGLRPSLEQVAGHNPDVYRKFIRLMRLTDLVRASGMQKIK